MATLKAGLRFGGPNQPGTAHPQPHDEPQHKPRASWVLQVHRGQWVLLLSSYGPGDLTLPAGFANQELAVNDVDGALAWAGSVLPEITENTITCA